eukprot:TRINITY_DN488_c0_g1_i2.p1 TRINITY_DN488_c0_g1~~TRINITY_DN488_c0_g1_i2.p1  ORF type:complete len:278 (+),score=35.79 TRINITY_DN488_c0_g1_i2:63-896(+)
MGYLISFICYGSLDMSAVFRQSVRKLLQAQSSIGRRYGSQASSVDPKELKKFRDLADQWWSLQGPFKGLHIMNPSRCLFIRRCVCTHLGDCFESVRPFERLDFLDVGCGGGILSESLARMGANVVGIDAEETIIRVAQQHALLDTEISQNIQYEHITAEALVEQGKQFDVVIASEVIEHVRQPEQFMNTLSSGQTLGVKAQRFRGHTSPHRNVKEAHSISYNNFVLHNQVKRYFQDYTKCTGSQWLCFRCYKCAWPKTAPFNCWQLDKSGSLQDLQL